MKTMKTMNKRRLKTVARATGSFKAQENELMLFGVIGDYWDDLAAQQIVNQIKQMRGDIAIRVNSPGGDVFDGIAIMNALKAHEGKKTFIVEALAASIASVITVGAADEIIMAEGSYLMIHNPWTLAIGDASEFEHTAGVLRQLEGTLRSIYSKKTGLSDSEVKEMLDAETWLDSSEAIKLGFADKTDMETEDSASVEDFDLTVFNNTPERLKIAAKAARPKTIRDFENVLHTAGFSRSEARAVASAGFGALDQRDAEERVKDSEKLLAAIEAAKNILKQE